MTYYITAVRLSPAVLPLVHQHIDAVRLSDGQEVTRTAVANAIRNRDTFYTKPPPPTPGALVHLMKTCPNCTAQDYITTNPDYTKANNLLHLPRF